MKLKVVIHKAEEGGYWAEVPAIPGYPAAWPREKPSMSCLIISMKLLKVCLSLDIQDIDISDNSSLKTVSRKQFGRLLEAKGWNLKHINGSHHICAKLGNAVADICSCSWQHSIENRIAKAS